MDNSKDAQKKNRYKKSSDLSELHSTASAHDSNRNPDPASASEEFISESSSHRESKPPTNRAKERMNILSYDHQGKLQKPLSESIAICSSVLYSNPPSSFKPKYVDTNCQENGLRKSYNTQGFCSDIYQHKSIPHAGGSGYNGSMYGGQGFGDFRKDSFSLENKSNNKELEA